MLVPNNKIIIIDNEPDELFDLAKVFLENGLPCRTFEYDQFYSSPLNNVRIAFFDIKLNPSGTEKEEQIFSTLADAIKLYISADNSPFALVFWTNQSSLVAKFTKFVRERYDDVPSPFAIEYIDKVEVKNRPDQLLQKIKDILRTPSISILFDFEAKAQRASSVTMDRIFKVIPKNDEWGNSKTFIRNFEAVFAKIASHSLGFEHAKSFPDKAVNQALLPILNHDFLSIVDKDQIWKNFIQVLQNVTKESELSYPENFTSSELNSIFHIDTSSEIASDTRGGVFSIDMSRFIVPIEFKIQYYFSLKDYFKEVQLFISQMFFRLNSSTPAEIKGRIENETQFIAVEISASCDFSQNKNRTNKYILGALTPYFDKREYLDRNSSADSILHKDIPNIMHNGKEALIWLNLNYVFSDIEITTKIEEPLFIIKKELVDMIGNRYANHVSRIGITSF